MRGVLVDLLDDAEGYVPLEVEYLPANPMAYRILEHHRDLASQSRGAALDRGRQLARRLRLTYIAHHL